MAGSEAEWLKNFLANIPLGMKPTPFVSIHCDCQLAIAIAKNKNYNGKNRHIQLRHNLVKQLLKSGTISIDYVKSKRNLVDPLTKPLRRNMILEISRGMRLKPFANKQVMVTQPLWLEIPWKRFIWVKKRLLVSSDSTKLIFKSIMSIPMVCVKVLKAAFWEVKLCKLNSMWCKNFSLNKVLMIFISFIGSVWFAAYTWWNHLYEC